MNCLSAQEIEAIVNGEASSSSLSDFYDRHLVKCVTCRHRYEQELAQASSLADSTLRPTDQESSFSEEFDRHWPPPEQLAQHSRWRVLDVLGSGGMGTVYLVVDRDGPQLFRAVKICREEVLNRERDLRRFQREAESIRSLPTHPNLVALDSIEWSSEWPMIFMEFVRGVDLEQWAQQFPTRQLPIELAVSAAIQTLLGLRAAWTTAELIHRDIKPKNLMRTSNGTIKVLDFGLAKSLKTSDSLQLTTSHTIAGTPLYAAPEQDKDLSKADLRADIYSLSGTLYRLLTGRAVFGPETGQLTATAIRLAHHQEQPIDVRQLRSDVPRQLARVITSGLAKSPGDRPQTHDEMIADLLPFADQRQQLNVALQLGSAITARSNRRSRQLKHQERRFRLTRRQAVGVSLAATICAAAGYWTIQSPSTGWLVFDEQPKDWRLLIDDRVVNEEEFLRADDKANDQDSASTRVRVLAGSRRIVWQHKETDEKAGQARVVLKAGQQVRISVPVASKEPTTVAPIVSRDAKLVHASGRWERENEDLCHYDGDGEQWLLFGDETWRNIDFGFDYFHDGFPVGVSALFRFTSAEQCVHFGVGWIDFYTALIEYTTPQKRYNQLAGPRGAYRRRLDWRVLPRKWYSVQLFLRDDTADCLVDGKLIFRADSIPYEQGQVGLRLFRKWKGCTRFRNIHVADENRTTIWKGPPELPEMVDRELRS